MCGIAGYFGSLELPWERIQAALDLMGRRGPDHAAYRHWKSSNGKNVYLLHSRLSIIDLDERANQPFRADRKWIVLNGELYNYLEQRRCVEAAGAEFRTTSDTEVLLQAIDRFGWEVLDRCEGMWAFAVYDETEDSLTLCRDRFGEKPLYLHRDATGLYFGSEVKFIRALLGRRLPVNLSHLYRYLVNGYRALYKQPETFFEGITEVPPATRLRLDAGGCEEMVRYWVPRPAPDEAMLYEEAVLGARERLFRAVELRLRADVPLAFCMSGGVDSNALISIAKHVFKYDVHGFTIVNTDSRYDEQSVVDQVVRDLDIRHTAIPVNTRDFLPNLRELICQHDAPVYTISYYAHWLLMESIARQGYRVSVSGTGADELFSGYYDHHLFYLSEVRDDLNLYADSLHAWDTYVRQFVRNPFLSDPDLFVRTPGFRGHIFLNADGFARFLKRPWFEPFAERNYVTSPLRNRMLNELFEEAVPVILHEDDLNSMYFSIENRSPFLDRDLFEFCYRVPTRYLVRNGYAKALLRDSVRGIAPDVVVNNYRKVGFNVPICSFLSLQDPQTRAALLEPGPIYDHLHREKIAQLLEKDALPNSESKFLFNFLCASMFLEEYC